MFDMMGMKVTTPQDGRFYVVQAATPLSPKPCSGMEPYWPSHHAEKSSLAPIQKLFLTVYSGTDSGLYTKKLFSLHSGITKALKIKGLQSPLQPPYRLPITDALTADMVIILALARCRICHAPNDVTWVSYCCHDCNTTKATLESERERRRNWIVAM